MVKLNELSLKRRDY